MKSDGGPAFPETHRTAQQGMTLRDYFAGQVLAGMIRANHVLTFKPEKDDAKWAYEVADCMLAERDK